MPNPSAQVTHLLSNGEDFLGQENYVQALAVFETAQAQAQQINNPVAEVLALQRLSGVHLEQGKLTLAMEMAEQALAIALLQNNVHALYECHRLLAQIYKATLDFELALKHLETAEFIRDNILRSGPGGAMPPANIAPTAPPYPAPPGLDYDALQVPMLFRTIVEQANIGVVISQDGHIVYCNDCLQRWLGYTLAELRSFDLTDFVLPSDRDSLVQCRQTKIAYEDQPCQYESPLRCRDGSRLQVEFHEANIEYRHRPAILTFMRDVTQARQIEDQLKKSEAQYHSLFDQVPIGLCRFSAAGYPVDANPALINIFGFDDRETFLGTNAMTYPGEDSQWQDCLSQVGQLKCCELKLSRQDGRHIWVRVSARAVCNADGQTIYYEGAVEDITEIRAAQVALEELAIRDSLTHIYNRRHFFEIAQREITRAVRFNRPLTLLLLDIDHFKAINDTYGHLVGDKVLRDVVRRLHDNLRQSDILARYGGEEFILLLPETNQAQAWGGAERLRKIIAATPFNGNSGSIPVTVSIGATSWISGADGERPDINDLISKADQALYRAKQLGRNQVQAEAEYHSSFCTQTAC
ncbi:MAG: diguanylate cyclase [Nodosilinea sp.]